MSRDLSCASTICRRSAFQSRAGDCSSAPLEPHARHARRAVPHTQPDNPEPRVMAHDRTDPPSRRLGMPLRHGSRSAIDEADQQRQDQHAAGNDVRAADRKSSDEREQHEQESRRGDATVRSADGGDEREGRKGDRHDQRHGTQQRDVAKRANGDPVVLNDSPLSVSAPADRLVADGRCPDTPTGRNRPYQSPRQPVRLRGGEPSCAPSPYRPPVTSMNEPVTYEAAGDSSQRMACATSSALPPRFIGTPCLTRSTRSGSPPLLWMSV